jgi:predicted O-methyltransferase YrrM
MIEIVNKKIETYLDSLNPSKDPLLKEMEALAYRKSFPIVGPLVGKFLHQLTRIARAGSVFEMGSGFGYSTYWFATALPFPGFIYHTDKSAVNSKLAQEFLRKGRQMNKVRFLVGDALELLGRTKEMFDLVFIDIEKEDYPAAYEKAKKRVAPGGLLVADNALWSGRVLEKKADEATEAIKKFNHLLATDKDFIHTIVPLRDGLSVNYKLK